jgi:hypothetical protein
MYRPPLCLSAGPPKTIRRKTGHKPPRPGEYRERQPHIRCGIPRTHSWASAATPAQRNATRHPQVPPRRASDVINGTNLLRKDNPRRPNGNAAETIAFLLVTQPLPPVSGDKRKSRRVRIPGLPRLPRLITFLRPPGWLCAPRWLSVITRHAGARLFVKTDTEAGWRHWGITELRGGLARRYRDPRFDALRSLHDVAEQINARFGSPRPGEQEDRLQ